MKSLRARLTLSYAVVVCAVLALVAIVASGFVFGAVAAPTIERVGAAAARARAVVAAMPHAPHEAVVRAAASAARGTGVAVFSPYDGPRRGRPPAPPPHGERAPHGPGGMGPGARGFWLDVVLSSALGAHPVNVRVADDEVVIAPDLADLDATIHRYLEALAVALAAAVAASWLVARWITAQAIAPLIEVTRELRRFGSGDFGARDVSTTEGAELGDLIAAYNAAGTQVSAAFAERTLVEQRMRRFLADAGHELRTPLTVMSGYLEILGKGGVDDPTTRVVALATLGRETLRMRALVERLMALARLERTEISDAKLVDVASVARDSIERVARARGGAITLAAPHAAQVFADPVELHEALDNLVENAVKYGAGTPVAVSVEPADDTIRIRVRDGGPGVPVHERNRLFERFFRGEDRGEIDGSGLGLAIAERAIRRCGGTVALENGEPGATTFVLSVPAAAGHPRAAAPLRL